MKHLKFALFFLLAAMVVFAQRGGGGHAGGGGGGHAVGGGGHMGGGISGGMSGGGMRAPAGGSFGGGMRAPAGGGVNRGGFNGGSFNNGINRGGFNNGFRDGRFGGNRFFNRGFGGFGFGFGYPFYGYPYYGLGYGYPGYYYDGYYPYDTGYSDPYAYNSYGTSYPAYSPSYNDDAYLYGAQQQPPVVINQNLGTPTPPIPGTGTESFYRRPDYYLLAFNDHTIQAALSYRVEGDTIIWMTREHEEKRAPLSSVDRRFTEQMNRDRHVEIRLQ